MLTCGATTVSCQRKQPSKPCKTIIARETEEKPHERDEGRARVLVARRLDVETAEGQAWLEFRDKSLERVRVLDCRRREQTVSDNLAAATPPYQQQLTFAEFDAMHVQFAGRVERDDFSRHERLQKEMAERLVRVIELERVELCVVRSLDSVRLALLALPARARDGLAAVVVVVRVGGCSSPPVRSRGARCHFLQRVEWFCLV